MISISIILSLTTATAILGFIALRSRMRPAKDRTRR